MAQDTNFDIDIYGDKIVSEPKESNKTESSVTTQSRFHGMSNPRGRDLGYGRGQDRGGGMPLPLGPRHGWAPTPRYTRNAARPPPPPPPAPFVLWCVRCRSNTHLLKDCVDCNEEGYMEGCPKCNTLDHQLFECPIEFKRQEEYHYTRQCRRNRPPWRMRQDHRDIRKLFNGFDVSEPDEIPWTAEFSKRNARMEIPRYQIDPAWMDYDNVPTQIAEADRAFVPGFTVQWDWRRKHLTAPKRPQQIPGVEQRVIVSNTSIGSENTVLPDRPVQENRTTTSFNDLAAKGQAARESERIGPMQLPFQSSYAGTLIPEDDGKLSATEIPREIEKRRRYVEAWNKRSGDSLPSLPRIPDEDQDNRSYDDSGDNDVFMEDDSQDHFQAQNERRPYQLARRIAPAKQRRSIADVSIFDDKSRNPLQKQRRSVADASIYDDTSQDPLRKQRRRIVDASIFDDTSRDPLRRERRSIADTSVYDDVDEVPSKRPRRSIADASIFDDTDRIDTRPRQFNSTSKKYKAGNLGDHTVYKICTSCGQDGHLSFQPSCPNHRSNQR
ncbi:hypothetical protein BGAL_0020g00360 [Botrytis galanthina]|uniref:CCHC-type domain-containing protein n=1 Tax=Botrytis galanthina TaxID=278940 RepID=A0A4S8RC52_9HELO|nr:hypothetical protein BGAL_0020g00360 [Botrytis galanthina]